MSGGERIPAREAAPIARRFVDLVQPYCDRLVVAGSLRRRLPTVADVELCVVPRIATVESVTEDLFGERQTVIVDALHDFLDRCVEDGIVQKRPRADGATFWGPRAKYLLFDGLPFDVFSAVNDWRDKKNGPPTAEPDRFGIMLVIRTGPADYSHRLVTPKDQKCEVKKLGNGRPVMRPGLLPEIYRVADGWLTYRTSAEKISTPEESDVYRLLGLDYAEPWQRG